MKVSHAGPCQSSNAGLQGLFDSNPTPSWKVPIRVLPNPAILNKQILSVENLGLFKIAGSDQTHLHNAP